MSAAEVIILAGPSGAGKTRLADRLGWPVVRLDDFYRDHDDPALPRLADGLVDWDDPRSWRQADAMGVLEQLCSGGACEVPDYDISQSRQVGTHQLDARGAAYVVAEGIFAHHLVEELRNRDLLLEAICVTQPPVVTFIRRLTRDLREKRKSARVLISRGLRLMRQQPRVVADARAHGARPMSAREAEVLLEQLTRP
ncbi:MAG: ATP-binding protein [Marmoricola sp.]|jgi:uridine kinase